MMKALIAPGDGSLRVENVAVPVIGEYDCLVKMKSCLFCNTTDRHIVEKTFNYGIPYPCILGHESLGQVISVGDKVKNFSSGDWVIRPYAIYPDEVSNNIGSGWGGFAEFGKIKDFKAMTSDSVVKAEDVPGFFKYMQMLPEELDPDKCMMISCLKEIFSSVKQISPVKNRAFLVAGAGVAGCLFAVFLKMAGAEHVTVTARRKEQLDFVLKNTTADRVVSIDDISLLGRSFDALVDTTGSVETVMRLLDRSIKPDGVFYSYAVYQEMARHDFWDAFKKKVTFQRIDPVEASVHEEVCKLLIDGKLDTKNYISHVFKLDQTEKAWSTVLNKKSCKTAIIF